MAGLVAMHLVLNGNTAICVASENEIVEREIVEDIIVEDVIVEDVIVENEIAEREIVENEISEDVIIENEISELEVFSAESEQEEFLAMEEMILEDSEQTEEEELCVGFSLKVEEDVSTVKAGQSVGYELYLENTGNVDLENLVIRPIFDNGNLEGTWILEDGLSINEESKTARLSYLEAGTSKKLVVMVETTEDREKSISAEFLVRAVNPLEQEEILNQSASCVTEIVPLTVDFSVSKWADRSMALPGETILYQICIKNTGERTLHSVLTTEKFVNAGVQAQFQEKDGVILNGNKTQALISEIKPGEAFGLNALVTIPENMESGELLNEVIVITAETGEEKFTAQAKVEILEKTELQETAVGEEIATERTRVPKTEDLSKTEFWAGVFGISCLLVIAVYWIQKAKRKH